MCNFGIHFASVLVYRISRSRSSAYYHTSIAASTGTLLQINNRVRIKKRFTGAEITQKASQPGEEEQAILGRERLL